MLYFQKSFTIAPANYLNIPVAANFCQVQKLIAEGTGREWDIAHYCDDSGDQSLCQRQLHPCRAL
jgi:hypothetical protein